MMTEVGSVQRDSVPPCVSIGFLDVSFSYSSEIYSCICIAVAVRWLFGAGMCVPVPGAYVREFWLVILVKREYDITVFAFCFLHSLFSF